MFQEATTMLSRTWRLTKTLQRMPTLRPRMTTTRRGMMKPLTQLPWWLKQPLIRHTVCGKKQEQRVRSSVPCPLRKTSWEKCTIIFHGVSTPTYDLQWALHVLPISPKLRCPSWWYCIPLVCMSIHQWFSMHHKGQSEWSLQEIEAGTHQALMHRTEGKCKEMLLLCHRNRIPWLCINQRRHQASAKEGTSHPCTHTTSQCKTAP